jgi:signal transduction histidine kinase
VTALPSWSGRRGPLIAEVAALAVLVVADSVFIVRGDQSTGVVPAIVTTVAPGAGPTVAVLALLRRRFADRVLLLGWAVAGLSLLGSVISTIASRLGESIPVQPGATETLALALLVGAACHRLAPRPAAGLAAAGVLIMVAGPLLRYGFGSVNALLAVPAALLWGGALAVGLLLRDADARHRLALAQVRATERIRLARELHDLVAHHITGVVVRAQAARVIAAHRQPTDPVESADIFAEIEQAGAEALAAMRRLVGMLRTGQEELASVPAGLAEAITDAVGEDSGATVTVAEQATELAVTPETASTVHRLIMEAVTNSRRHAPRATELRVDVRVDERPERPWLVVEVANNGVLPGSPTTRPGYGLVGMSERVTALGGRLHAGEEPGQRWLVTAQLPLDPRGAEQAEPPGVPEDPV